ncbi:MAG TPA: T9SS type A sorting domain-containing protein, partial [Ferruginibacter sp.]|nr:T9SS type A sorting domain-containing protein [Ferruginibacter sp.]
SSVEKNYRTTDDRPVRGINYYRLKPVDRDGSYHYSETRSVWWSHSTEIVVAPNPAKEKTVVYIPGNAGWVDIQLFDPLGRLISRQQRTGETVSIDLFSLNRGVYYLIIESSEQRVTRKIVVE